MKSFNRVMYMKTIIELMEQYYAEFVGLPGNRPIVRNNQQNDALELVVLKILYGKDLPEFTKSNVNDFWSEQRFTKLMKGLSDGYGMMLAIVGSGFIMMFFTLLSFMQLTGV